MTKGRRSRFWEWPITMASITAALDDLPLGDGFESTVDLYGGSADEPFQGA
jgi:hypothetical protein